MASEEVFEELRPGLTRASYQILGSWADAEDIVQSTWLKCRRHHDSVESPRTWLTKVATRESIDGLRAHQARREGYPGEWLPEAVSVAPGPEDVVTDRSALSAESPAYLRADPGRRGPEATAARVCGGLCSTSSAIIQSSNRRCSPRWNNSSDDPRAASRTG